MKRWGIVITVFNVVVIVVMTVPAAMLVPRASFEGNLPLRVHDA